MIWLMQKNPLLSGIDIESIDVDATLDKLIESTPEEGFKGIEKDVYKAAKGIYNWLAKNDESAD